MLRRLCDTSHTRCRPTHPIPIQCWASVASSTTLIQRYTNSTTTASTATTGRLTNVASLSKHVCRWPDNNPTFCIHTLPHRTAAIALCGWRFYRCLKKGNYPNNTYIGPIVKYCWATVCDAGSTLYLPRPFKLLNTNIIVNVFFSEHFSKTVPVCS